MPVGIESNSLGTFPPVLNKRRFQNGRKRVIPNLTHQVQTTPVKAATDEVRADRQYLAVPYSERIAAKADGALWDKEAKSWYAGPKADMSKLQRWLPENVKSQQAPAMTPREEFVEALYALGCVVNGQHPVMDGKTHRIETVGDKSGERSGFYVGHLDGHPAGHIQNNRTGESVKWKAKGYSLSEADKAQLQAESAAKLQAREVAQKARKTRWPFLFVSCWPWLHRLQRIITIYYRNRPGPVICG